MKKLLVTSALPYANGSIHIGHLVEYIQTDVWVRYWRLRGRDAIYICADDTHGTPIMIRARDEGIPPESLIERMREEHLRDFTTFQIGFDNYYSTHSEENRQLSSEIYLAQVKGGHMPEKEIEQAFCPKEQIFLPDRFIKGKCPNCGAADQYGDACEKCSKTYNAKELVEPYCSNCGATPIWKPSSHAFFRVSDFTEELQAWLKEGVRGEVSNKLQEWFKDGLQDWDITRDAPYFGFEIPGRDRQYFYVWLDAPVGYMASTLNWCNRNGADFDAYWRDSEEADVYHFIGKDIVYFHALFWPALLMGAGFRTPTGLCVHGFLTVGGEKMSKSRGTFITAQAFVEHLDPQYLRFYYAAKLDSGIDDVDLNLDDFVLRVNSDMLGKIANIPSRVMKILHDACEGRLGEMDAEGRALWSGLLERRPSIAEAYERREFSAVSRILSEAAGEINVYLEQQAPWKLARENVPRTQAVCTSALNAFKVLVTYLQPILPEFGAKFAEMVGELAFDWDSLERVVENRTIQPYTQLAKRIDPKQVTALVESQKSRKAAPVELPQLFSEPLARCQFSAAKVISAMDVPNTNGLIRLVVEADGDEATIMSKLGHDGTAARLVGREILLLKNLESRKVAGQISEGMLLAADGGEGVVPIIVR